MRILLATAHPYLPEIAGGAQSSMHETARALQAQGHEVAVLSGLDGKGAFGFRARLRLKLGRRKTVCDTQLGYPVYRGWFPWEGVAEVVKRFKPDVASPQSGLSAKMAHTFREAGVPTVLYFRNVELDDLGGEVPGSADRYIANSQFTAGRVKELYGVDAIVIPPIFDAARYRTETTRRYVTFINPHPHKGRDIAFEVARLCPDVEFLFVRAWTLSEQDEQALLDCAAACPNVTVRARTNDMRSIYGQTRLLIAPSQWEEAWGRIATEAHFSGIPVLASDIGGLPEAVGPGGRLVSRDAPAQVWAETLRAMIGDPDAYQALCDASLAYSHRPEIGLDDQVRRFVECCAAAVAKRG